MCRSKYSSNLIGRHPNFAGNRPPGTAHAYTVANEECVSVSVVFLQSPMALPSSGMLSASGTASVVVDTMSVDM